MASPDSNLTTILRQLSLWALTLRRIPPVAHRAYVAPGFVGTRGSARRGYDTWQSSSVRARRMLQTQPLSPGIGAEALDVDLSRPLPGARFRELEQAFYANQVLAIPTQRLAAAQSRALARRIGPPQPRSFSIFGMPRHEGDARLDKLNAFLTQPKCQLRFKDGLGDIVSWDHASLQHATTSIDPDDRCTLWRVTLLESSLRAAVPEVLAASFGNDPDA